MTSSEHTELWQKLQNKEITNLPKYLSQNQISFSDGIKVIAEFIQNRGDVEYIVTTNVSEIMLQVSGEESLQYVIALVEAIANSSYGSNLPFKEHFMMRFIPKMTPQAQIRVVHKMQFYVTKYYSINARNILCAMKRQNLLSNSDQVLRICLKCFVTGKVLDSRPAFSAVKEHQRRHYIQKRRNMFKMITCICPLLDEFGFNNRETIQQALTELTKDLEIELITERDQFYNGYSEFQIVGALEALSAYKLTRKFLTEEPVQKILQNEAMMSPIMVSVIQKVQRKLIPVSFLNKVPSMMNRDVDIFCICT
jgi:hypothetical protein